MAFAWEELLVESDAPNGLIKTTQAYEIAAVGVVLNVVVKKTVDVENQRILALVSEALTYLPGTKLSGSPGSRTGIVAV